jgi:hypothetical protein
MVVFYTAFIHTGMVKMKEYEVNFCMNGFLKFRITLPGIVLYVVSRCDAFQTLWITGMLSVGN